MKAWNEGLLDGRTIVECKDALNNVDKMSMSDSHRVTQSFFLYRVDYTSSKLFKWRKRESGIYPRCEGSKRENFCIRGGIVQNYSVLQN